jgi:hypothetical protein
MVDLSPALEAFTARVGYRMCPKPGTQRGHANALMRINVPNVPTVPSIQLGGSVPSADDVLERAAFLEFCEGLDRPSADSQALHEFGFDSWNALAHEPGAARPSPPQ